MQYKEASSEVTYGTLLILFLVLLAATGAGYTLSQERAVAAGTPTSTTIAPPPGSQPSTVVTDREALITAAQNSALRLTTKPLDAVVADEFATSYQTQERELQTQQPITTNSVLAPEAAADAFIRARFPADVKSLYTAGLSDVNDSINSSALAK